MRADGERRLALLAAKSETCMLRWLINDISVEGGSAVFRQVNYLLRPKSIAIIGASDSSRGGWAQEIYSNLEHCGFPATIYLINPKRSELWGRPVFPNFAAIAEPVDLALTIIPSAFIPDTLAEAAQHGLKCALIYAAQFGEGGDAEGGKRAQALLALSDKYGLRISGPNCMGSLALREKLLLYPAKRVRALEPGPVGVVFQSGGTCQFWLQQAGLRGLGFSYAVSSGNELDIDLADYINFLVDDEHTNIIACLVEGIRRPQAFMAAAAKALAAGKPIVMVKVGRSERGKAAASHTGAIAGDDNVFDTMCRKYGIVRCSSLDDLIETCLAFTPRRLPKGDRIAMVCYTGGAKGLVLDYASDEGAEMAPLTAKTRATLPGMIDPGLAPENPLDVGPVVGVQPAKFAEICKVVCTDELMLVSARTRVSCTRSSARSSFLDNEIANARRRGRIARISCCSNTAVFIGCSLHRSPCLSSSRGNSISLGAFAKAKLFRIDQAEIHPFPTLCRFVSLAAGQTALAELAASYFRLGFVTAGLSLDNANGRAVVSIVHRRSTPNHPNRRARATWLIRAR